MKDTGKRISRHPDIKSVTIDCCFMRLTLDTRHLNKNSIFPVSVSFYFKGHGSTTYYHHLPYKMSEYDYELVCRSTGKGRPSPNSRTPYLSKIKLVELFDDIVDRVATYAKHKALTPQSVKSLLQGKDESFRSFLDFWRDYANSKGVATADSYNSARKSFIKHVGNLNGFKITSSEIKLWVKKMSESKPALSTTTIGIYLRSFRAVWHAAQDIGLVSNEDYPFGKTPSKVKIPIGANRIKNYLSVAQMSELYRIFVSSECPNGLMPKEYESIKFSLGVFLLQYLCNGCNMADLAELRYDDYYFATNGKALRFVRHKTKGRSAKEVIIPITRQLRTILDSMAAPAVKGDMVIPSILNGSTSDPREIQKRVRQENKNVKDRLQRLLSVIEWPVAPSGTWARHSFATNLSHAGIPREYISEAMGHTISHASVTSRYIDQYPLQTQMIYNQKLITEIDDIEGAEEMVTISKMEYEELLRQLGNKKESIE